MGVPLKYGVKTQFCQSSKHMISQYMLPKASKRHELSTGLMLGTIWSHKSFETQKLL